MPNGKEGGGKAAVGVALGVGAVGGGLLGALLAARPAKAAAPDEKLDHLIDISTAILAALDKISGDNAQIIVLLRQIAGAQPGAPTIPEIEIAGTFLTPWVAKERELIFDQEVRQAGVVNADRMVDFRRGKRLLIKVESSLDQAAVVQVFGNIDDSANTAVNVGPPLPIAANANISVGLAWDDWHPWIGVRMTFGVAPTVGRMSIYVVIQE